MIIGHGLLKYKVKTQVIILIILIITNIVTIFTVIKDTKMELIIKEPTSEECNENIKVYENKDSIGFALWYPQMGGYIGKCVAVLDKNNMEESCVDCYIWHDGEFPFSDDDEVDRKPIFIHHCSADQFIDFGTEINNFIDKNK